MARETCAVFSLFSGGGCVYKAPAHNAVGYFDGLPVFAEHRHLICRKLNNVTANNKSLAIPIIRLSGADEFMLFQCLSASISESDKGGKCGFLCRAVQMH